MANLLPRGQENVVRDPIRGHYSLTVSRLSMPDEMLDNIFPTQHHPRHEHIEGRDGEVSLTIAVYRDADLHAEVSKIKAALAAMGYYER